MRFLPRIGARRKRRHPEVAPESAIELAMRSTPVDAPAPALPSAGLGRRRCRFAQADAHGLERSAWGFHMPQREHGSRPIPPMPFELIEERRAERKARQKAARRKLRADQLAAHHLRIDLMKAARALG